MMSWKIRDTFSVTNTFIETQALQMPLVDLVTFRVFQGPQLLGSHWVSLVILAVTSSRG